MKISKSAIFLFEVMMVILIFSAAAAICTTIFAKAHHFSVRSEDITMAAVKAQSAAEIFKSGTDNASMQALERDGSFTEYYDENWEKIPGDGDGAPAAYALIMTLKPEVSLPVESCEIDVRRLLAGEGDSVIKLQAGRYTGS